MRTKADIEFHSDGYGHQHSKPAVNVKVYKSMAEGFREFSKATPDMHPDFTEEWIDENLSDEEVNSYWEFAVERAWEFLEDDAQEIFDTHVKVYSEGRSGGWAIVDGINQDVDSWDAIEFSKWKKFAKYARDHADGIMYDIVDGIYYNKFEDWRDERSESYAPEIPERMITQ